MKRKRASGRSSDRPRMSDRPWTVPRDEFVKRYANEPDSSGDDLYARGAWSIEDPYFTPERVVDVMFVVDYSGSMSDNIENVKSEIYEAATQIQACSEARFGLVIFGSHQDNYEDAYAAEDPYDYDHLLCSCDEVGCSICNCLTATVTFTIPAMVGCQTWTEGDWTINLPWVNESENPYDLSPGCTWRVNSYPNYTAFNSRVTLQRSGSRWDVMFRLSCERGGHQFGINTTGAQCSATITTAQLTALCNGDTIQLSACGVYCDNVFQLAFVTINLRMRDCGDVAQSSYMFDALAMQGVSGGFTRSTSVLLAALDYPTGGAFEPAYSALRWAMKNPNFNWASEHPLGDAYLFLITDETAEYQDFMEANYGCTVSAPYENDYEDARDEAIVREIKVAVASDEAGCTSYHNILWYTNWPRDCMNIDGSYRDFWQVVCSGEDPYEERPVPLEEEPYVYPPLPPAEEPEEPEEPAEDPYAFEPEPGPGPSPTPIGPCDDRAHYYDKIQCLYSMASRRLEGVADWYYQSAYVILLLDTFDPEIDLLRPTYEAWRSAVVYYDAVPNSVLDAVRRLQTHILTRATDINGALYADINSYLVDMGFQLEEEFADLSGRVGYPIDPTNIA